MPTFSRVVNTPVESMTKSTFMSPQGSLVGSLRDSACHSKGETSVHMREDDRYAQCAIQSPREQGSCCAVHHVIRQSGSPMAALTGPRIPFDISKRLTGTLHSVLCWFEHQSDASRL